MDGSEGTGTEQMVPLGAVLGELDAQAPATARTVATDLLRTTKRTPPHAMDAERALLGGVFFDQNALDAVKAANITVGDFYRPAHGTIYAAMTALKDRGEPVDTLTVVDELERHGQLDEVGGAAAVAGIESLLATAAHVPAYARMVKDKANQRELIKVAKEIAESAYLSDAPPLTIVERTATKLERIRADQPTTSPFQVEIDRARKDLREHGLGAPIHTDEPVFAPALELLDMEIPKVSWLVTGVITDASVAMVGGEPKAFKTWAGLEILLSISTGTRAFGEFKTGAPRDVAAFLTEDDIASFKNRVLALARGGGEDPRGMDPERALGRMHYSCLKQLDLRRRDDAALLVASIRALPVPPAVVMIDPLRNVIGDAEEDKAHAMAPIMETCRAIRTITGATLLIVHHAGKATENSAKRRGGQNLRGSGAIHGALDCGLYLRDTKTDGQSQWQNVAETETKRARAAGRFGLELFVEDDEDGAAHRAWWVFHRDPKSMSPISVSSSPRTEKGRGEILELLRSEYELDMRRHGQARAWSAPAIEQRTEIPNRTVFRHLEQLELERKVERAGRGWIFNDTNEEEDLDTDQ